MLQAQVPGAAAKAAARSAVAATNAHIEAEQNVEQQKPAAKPAAKPVAQKTVERPVTKLDIAGIDTAGTPPGHSPRVICIRERRPPRSVRVAAHDQRASADDERSASHRNRLRRRRRTLSRDASRSSRATHHTACPPDRRWAGCGSPPSVRKPSCSRSTNSARRARTHWSLAIPPK